MQCISVFWRGDPPAEQGWTRPCTRWCASRGSRECEGRANQFGVHFIMTGDCSMLQIPERRAHPEGKLMGLDNFASGQWQELIVESTKFAEEAATVMRRHRRDAHCLQGGRHWKVPTRSRHASPRANLDDKIFNRNVRFARKGAAGGPSRMTSDHSRPSFDSNRDTHLLLDCWRGSASQIQCARF